MHENDTKQFFEKYAADFDDLYGTQKSVINTIINTLFRRSMKLRYDKTFEECSPLENKTVIDIGCGPGYYALSFASNGASKVLGIDFSQNMIDLATKKAAEANVDHKCSFIVDDFSRREFDESFDYAVLMGIMDYIEEPSPFLEKVFSITTEKVVISFPRDGGILAWQRKMRYRNRCPLFMYTEADIKDIFKAAGLPNPKLRYIGRDIFATVEREK